MVNMAATKPGSCFCSAQQHFCRSGVTRFMGVNVVVACTDWQDAAAREGAERTLTNGPPESQCQSGSILLGLTMCTNYAVRDGRAVWSVA